MVSLRLLAPLALALAASGAASASPIVVTASGTKRSDLPPHFYGANAQQRGTFDWQGTGLDTSPTLANMHYGLFRIPCGTGANFWDWKQGINLNKARTQYRSPLSELHTEVATAGAVPVYVLNLLTDPTKGGVVYPKGGPRNASQNLAEWPFASQLGPGGILATYQRSYGEKIPYLELGNEYYFFGIQQGRYGQVYPTGAAYAQVASEWTGAVAAHDPPGVTTCATVYASDIGGQPQRWNASLNTSGFAPSACILHLYPAPNLPTTRGPVDGPDGHGGNLAEDLIGSAFLGWQKMDDFDFNGSVSAPGGGATGQQLPAGAPVWITEYNLNSENSGNRSTHKTRISQYYGTWAHALTLGAMSLKFIEPVYDRNDGKHDRWAIDMLIHHEVVAGAGYGDIFENTAGLDSVRGAAWRTAPATAALAMTGPGLVSMEINTAAKGQSKAERLVFGAPEPTYTVTDYWDGGAGTVTVPCLYAWEFGGNGSQQAVILNLSTARYAVDLSGLVQAIAASVQIYNGDGHAGIYITDGTPSDPKAVDSTGAPAKLIVDPTLRSPSSVALPPFSLTRLVFTPTGGNTL